MFCGPQSHAFSCKHEMHGFLTLGIILFEVDVITLRNSRSFFIVEHMLIHTARIMRMLLGVLLTGIAGDGVIYLGSLVGIQQCLQFLNLGIGKIQRQMDIIVILRGVEEVVITALSAVNQLVGSVGYHICTVIAAAVLGIYVGVLLTAEEVNAVELCGIVRDTCVGEYGGSNVYQ